LRERPPYELRADFRRGPTRLRFSIDTDMTTRTTTSTNGGAPDVSAPTQSSTAAEVEIHDLVYGSSGTIVGLTQPEKEMSNGVEMYLPNTRVRYERRGNVWTNRFLGGGFKLETMKSEYLQPFYPGVWLDDITLPPGVPEVGRTWDVPLSHSKLMFGSMRLETTDGYIRGRVSDANLTGSPAWAEIEFSYRLSGPMKSWVPDSPMRMRILGEGTLKLRINLDEHYVLGGEWLTTNTVNSKMTGAFNIDTEAVVTSKNIITVTPLEWGNGRPQVARNGATATGSSNSTTPPQVIVRIAPAYPRRALMRGIEGTTTVGITVGPTGAVEDVSIRESSGDSSLDDAAIVAARKWKFTPAMEGDHPIKALTTQRITFKLEN
jgi:TonB family protein